MSEKNRKAFRRVLPGTMCFLTLLCIAAAVKNNIFRECFICLVSITDLIGLIFLTILSGYLLKKTEESSRPLRFYMLLILNIHLMTFFAALMVSVYRIPHHFLQITIFSTVCYFFSMAVYLTLWLYQKQFLEKTAVTRSVTVLMIIALSVYTAALIINLFRPVLFHITRQGGFSTGVTDYISVITAFFCLMLLCIATFFSNLSRNRKISFLCCILAPALFATLSVNQGSANWGIYIWGIVSITIVLPLCLIFFNAHDELENDVLRNEKEQARLRMAVMVSQMQPHFLYNSLAVIEALCEEDPRLAAEATNAFSNYLRENMDFADRSSPIPFLEELNHIKTYVWLEKLRFPNKLKMEYDIRCTAFFVPALSVQPMVENAIKHGICRSRSGGTVRLCSFETERHYNVIVSDDGTGFDVRKMTDDSRQHLGIRNTGYRIREMVGGSLDIVSAPGKGTTVTIRIPR